MEALDPIPATTDRFQFGFVWIDLIDWRYKEPDPRLAIPQVRKVHMTVDPFIKFEKFPLPLAPCRREQFSYLTD